MIFSSSNFNFYAVKKFTTNLLHLAIIFCTFILTSCQKDIEVGTDNSQTNSQEGISAKRDVPLIYKIDGKIVSKEGFFTTLLGDKASFRSLSSDMEYIASRYLVVQELSRPEIDGIYDVTNAFTANSAYIDYAVGSGYTNVETVENAYADLAAYAESSGAIAAFESTGDVPPSYLAYEANYFRAHDLPYEANNLGVRTLVNWAYTGCSGNSNNNVTSTGESSLPLKTTAWLGFQNMDNKISSFRIIGIGGRNDVFDRSFYRNRLFGFWSWGNNLYDFCGGAFQFADNRASSWFVL